ncbi:RES domain-containing protein [Mucilaginibacter hurinus]|uniref:RES domain-containing protein n=1 Tax=Mucilaginibacter hurinus TaxID=2201324 RepID=A0A367GKV2_9SPHI|nr:RES family NAD+ phosphorylase [Mucilaginibacter hurinus]RCH54112.1 RES domain-containing protein [Mucilaginibacter hurinus]
MIVYRITNCEYAGDLSGMGARLFGGRWNSEGRSMLYTASSRSLAVLEILVHLPPLMIPDNYCAVEIEIPDNNIKTLNIANLSPGWQDVAATDETRKTGDKFINERKQLVMRVPSAIVPAEFNYLINPRHQDIDKVKIVSRSPFSFDERLFFKR